MAKIRNISGMDLEVPSLGGRLVLAGQVVDVEPGEVYGFTQQPLWEPVDSDAEQADLEGEADYQGRLAEANGFTPEAPVEPETPTRTRARRKNNSSEEG